MHKRVVASWWITFGMLVGVFSEHFAQSGVPVLVGSVVGSVGMTVLFAIARKKQ